MSEKSRNWQHMASLHCTTSAAVHKIYPTLSNCVQPEQWTKMLNICPIIDRVTRPSFAQRCVERRRKQADGWIDEGWEHVTGTLSKLSG